MHTLILIMIVGAVVSMLATPFLMRRPSKKKRYQNMADRALVASNTQARIMKKRMRFAVYVMPLLIALLISVFHANGALLDSLACLLAVNIFGGLWGVSFFRTVENLTTVEMDFRKFKRETETPNQAMHQQPVAGKYES